MNLRAQVMAHARMLSEARAQREREGAVLPLDDAARVTVFGEHLAGVLRSYGFKNAKFWRAPDAAWGRVYLGRDNYIPVGRSGPAIDSRFNSFDRGKLVLPIVAMPGTRRRNYKQAISDHRAWLASAFYDETEYLSWELSTFDVFDAEDRDDAIAWVANVRARAGNPHR
jgi:hypothetical protein